MSIQSMTLTTAKPIYYAGEVITGFCNVSITAPMQIGVINMRFEGNSNVHWTETRTESHTDADGKTHSETVTDHYSSHQELICIHRDLVVQGGYLQPGVYQLPFAIDTPYTLPSSFEGHHGSVRYYVKAKKPRFPGFTFLFAQKVKTFVQILQPIDTNIPMYMFPVAGCDNKTICCLCCASGPLTIEAHTDRAAYCPGENVLVSAKFENKSSREVRPYVRLVQHQRFYAEGHSNYACKNYDLTPAIQDLSLGSTASLKENDASEWRALPFQIPPCYSAVKTQNIDISYCLEVCMEIPMAFDLKVSLPIVLATIPYRGPVQAVTMQPGASAVPTGWSGVGAQASGQRLDSLPAPPIAPANEAVKIDGPPPSYFATVFQNDAALAQQEDANKPKKK